MREYKSNLQEQLLLSSNCWDIIQYKIVFAVRRQFGWNSFGSAEQIWDNANFCWYSAIYILFNMLNEIIEDRDDLEILNTRFQNLSWSHVARLLRAKRIM